MKLIIGNSHASSLAGNIDHEHNLSGFQQISDDIFTLWHIPFQCWNITEEIIHDKIKICHEKIDENTLILGYLGSSEIRETLSKYKNAKDIAEKYAETFLKYFSKYSCRVGFIDPVPVANDLYFFERDINYDKWGNGSREEIQEQYDIFVKELDKYSDIRIKLVNNIIPSNFLTKHESHDGCHLDRHIVQNLIDHIDKIKY